jgi:cell wall-associated NlpC family hydrolase
MIPGDLIFWGPGGSQHVGIYIGGGLMIAAPHTGDVVKIQAVWGHPVGAARP